MSIPCDFMELRFSQIKPFNDRPLSYRVSDKNFRLFRFVSAKNATSEFFKGKTVLCKKPRKVYKVKSPLTKVGAITLH